MSSIHLPRNEKTVLNKSENRNINFNAQLPEIDFTQLKVKILRSLRYPLSQRQFSQNLGFKFNQSLKWETHQKKLFWSQFCDLCQFRNLDLKGVLQSVFCIAINELSAANLLLQIFKLFYSNKNISDIAEELDLPPAILNRWCKGTCQPELDVILKLLHINTQLLGEFLAQLLPLAADNELSEFTDNLRKMRNLETEIPFMSAIQGCLFLDSYQNLEIHSDDFISQRTAIPLWKVKSVLQILQDRGLITWEASKRKFTSPPLRVDMGGLKVSEILRLASFWTERALARISDQVEAPINKRNNQNFLGYRIVPASKQSIKEINELLIQTNNRILQILEEDPHPMEEIRIILFHHFSADDCPSDNL
jgi:hypothetical protein